jgi:hypothetical protein
MIEYILAGEYENEQVDQGAGVASQTGLVSQVDQGMGWEHLISSSPNNKIKIINEQRMATTAG